MGHALVNRDGERVRKGRIRPALATAIRLIVEEGLTQADAAKRVGMKAPSLSIALHKPHVRAFKGAVKRAWLETKTDKAWLTMADLSERASSEDVRHKSAKVFLEAAGELDGSTGGDGPKRGAVVQIVINHSQQPTPHQLPGVIEQQAPQRIRPDPSNMMTVGRGSTVGESP